MHFTVAPHKVASQAALQTWTVSVKMENWLVGGRVVLDFPGVLHAEHGLHVHSIRPAEVARLISVTRHSAVVELLETASREFFFEALGDVDEVRIVCEVGEARPPPPSKSPPMSPSPPPLVAGARGDGGRATQPAEGQ